VRLLDLLVRPLQAASAPLANPEAGPLVNLALPSRARRRLCRSARLAGHRGCPRRQVLAQQRTGRTSLCLEQARGGPPLSLPPRTAPSHAGVLPPNLPTLACWASLSRRASQPRARRMSRVRLCSDPSVPGPVPSPRPKASMEREGHSGRREWWVPRRARGHRDCSRTPSRGPTRLSP
jgi:hypothetical protein